MLAARAKERKSLTLIDSRSIYKGLYFRSCAWVSSYLYKFSWRAAIWRWRAGAWLAGLASRARPRLRVQPRGTALWRLASSSSPSSRLRCAPPCSQVCQMCWPAHHLPQAGSWLWTRTRWRSSTHVRLAVPHASYDDRPPPPEAARPAPAQPAAQLFFRRDLPVEAHRLYRTKAFMMRISRSSSRTSR